LVGLDQRGAFEQLADESETLEQDPGIEARDVCSVTDTGVEDSDQRECADGLTE